MNAPISVTGGGTATLFYDWSTVAVLEPYTNPFGVVNGTITLVDSLQGPNGYDPSIPDPLATIGFSTNVVEQPVGQAVPEPATSVLLLLGLGGGCLAARRRSPVLRPLRCGIPLGGGWMDPMRGIL